MKKKLLLTSILSIVMCVSLIAGATFALFTSESKVNVAVSSATVKVTATVGDLTLGSTLGSNVSETTATKDGNRVKLERIVAGDYVTFDINVVNESNVSVQYRTVIEKISDDGLWDGLEVKIGGETYNGATKKTEWAAMTENEFTVSVRVELPSTAGSEYQSKSCEFAYSVEVVQGNAQMPSEWDGESSSAPSRNEENVYHITNASEFVSFIKTIEHGNDNPYTNSTVVLDCDIDLGGGTIEVSTQRCADGLKVEGQNHTVSNFTMKSTSDLYCGLFGYFAGYNPSYIKNVTVRNATVIGSAQTGVIVGSINNTNSTVENCKVYDSTVIGTKKVGAVVGYTANGYVTNCYAKDCTVYCADTRAEQAGAVVGFINTVDSGCYDHTSGNTYNNVSVSVGTEYVADGVVKKGSVYEISNANGLFWFNDQINNHNNSFGGTTIKLVANIDMKGADWLPAGQNYTYDYPALGYADPTEFRGTFDGNNKTISNINITGLTQAQVEQLDNAHNETTDKGINSVGFIGYIAGGTIKNLTIKNATVTGFRYVGTIVGYAELDAVIDNCHVEEAEISVTCIARNQCGDKVGGIVGNLWSTVKNCTVKDSTISAGRDAGQVVGCAQSGSTVEVDSCSAENVTVSDNGSCEEGASNINNVIIGRDCR